MRWKYIRRVRLEAAQSQHLGCGVVVEDYVGLRIHHKNSLAQTGQNCRQELIRLFDRPALTLDFGEGDAVASKRITGQEKCEDADNRDRDYVRFNYRQPGEQKGLDGLVDRKGYYSRCSNRPDFAGQFVHTQIETSTRMVAFDRL